MRKLFLGLLLVMALVLPVIAGEINSPGFGDPPPDGPCVVGDPPPDSDPPPDGCSDPPPDGGWSAAASSALTNALLAAF